MTPSHPAYITTIRGVGLRFRSDAETWEATTKVRTRLVLAFTYVLLVLIIALGVPLIVNPHRRPTTELTTQALLQAQGIAAQIGRDNIDDPARIDQIVTQAAAQGSGS
jgi:hypothetical protein